MEHEELEEFSFQTEKGKWNASRVFKILFWSVAVLIYAVLMVRIISACSSSGDNPILITEKTSALYPGGEVIRVDFFTDELENGSALPQSAVYLSDAECFQLTVKIRKKALPPREEGCGYRVELTALYGEEETVFPLSHFHFRDRFGYRYLRCAFDGVDLKNAKELVIRLYDADSRLVLSHQVYNPDLFTKPVTPDSDAFLLVE